MSHVSNISTDGLEFDLDVIKEMCEHQGWQFREGQETFAWYGRFMGDSPIPEGFSPEDYGKCNHAIRIPGCGYELGVVKSVGGEGYVVLADFWQDGGLNTVLGSQGEKFKQIYLQTSDIMWAEEKNFAWEQTPASVETAKKLVVYVSDDFGDEESWGSASW